MRRLVLCCAVLFAVGSAYGECDFSKAQGEAFKLLQGVEPKAEGTAKYRQVLVPPSGSEVPLQRETGYRKREVPLAVLDLRDCKVSVLVPTMQVKGERLLEPQGVKGLHLEPRVFGPIWNGLNTLFEFDDPNLVVLMEKWKPYHKDTVLNTPPSRRLIQAFPELVLYGRWHLREDSAESVAYLVDRGYSPEPLPERLRSLMPLLVLTETIDPVEFKWSDDAGRLALVHRALAYFGANGNNAMNHKVSTKGAKGPAQVWPPTCSDVRKRFKDSGLASDCNGAGSVSHKHVGNLAAGGLVARLKRTELLEEISVLIVDGPVGDRLLAASYNGGAGRVRRAFKEYGFKWDMVHTEVVEVKTKKGKAKRVQVIAASSILEETRDYLPKFDFVKQVEMSAGEHPFVFIGAR